MTKECCVKVNSLSNHDRVHKSNVNFCGYKPIKSENGFKEYQFSYPFDENKYDCYLEVFKLKKDRYNNVMTTGFATNRFDNNSTGYKLTNGINSIDLARTFGIEDNEPFAYHYILRDKNTGEANVKLDAGDKIDERGRNFTYGDRDKAIYNYVIPSGSDLSKGGAMKLVIIDSQKVGTVYNDHNVIIQDEKLKQRGINGIKTLTNKFGGTLAGLEKAIDNGEYDKYGRIISLPIFTDDDFTAHAYWNKNCFQMASSLGNINNYASLQRKMFAHGLNFVSDGAFVNEGLQGVHFKHLLKWGADSPYMNWFKASGLKDNPLSMGVFGKNTKYISHKIVNSPYTYRQDDLGQIIIRKKSSDDPTYNPNKPTYIQFFDRRLVTDSEKNDLKHLIKTYSKMSTSNVYNLHTHDDSIFPYAFEINPETYNANIKLLNEYNSRNENNSPIKLDDYKAARILSKFKNFEADGKFESGFETWDANPDIAKLNFVYSNADNKTLKNIKNATDKKSAMLEILRGNYQAQDYAIESGKFWTQKTDNILRLSIAQKLKNLDGDNTKSVYKQILNKADGKNFPTNLDTVLSENEVENVLTGLYKPKRTLSNENKKDMILEGLMNTPLDSFEFGDNIVSVLASPLITKRATVPSEVGMPRFEVFKNGNKHLLPEYKKTYEMMDDLYQKEMYDFAIKILDLVNIELPKENKLFKGDEVTEFGKYVLPLITPEIAKFATIKALAPDITVAIDKSSGEISYDYKKLKELSLQGIGIKNPASPQDEARMLISRIRSGIKDIDTSMNSEILDATVKMLKDTNVYSFKLADLIIDKTQSGLDWRIDATKDIADIEALRNGNTNFDYTWQSVIDFWKKFNNGVISKNPNAYTVAEITDEKHLHNLGLGYHSAKFANSKEIVARFERETGITSTANYTYFFSDIPKMFTKGFEDGGAFNDPKYVQELLYEKMLSGGQDGAFLSSGPLPSILYSYTFVGNHDKPRALHCAALDMSLFNSDLTYNTDGNYRNREMAYRMIKNNFMETVNYNDVNNYDYSAISPKAIAMGYALRKAFIDTINDYRDKGKMTPKEVESAFIAISQSVSDLSQGKFMDKRFNADAFGIKPFNISIEMVLKQALEKYDLCIPITVGSTQKFADDVFKRALDPAISKLLGMMKYLVALPGMPTLFDGDDVGATGYDSKTKNMYLQGRQRVHDEWLERGGKKYKQFIADHQKEFEEVMAVRKKPECNALNNGAPFTLPLQEAKDAHNPNIKYTVPAILRQSTDGRMAISLFNTSGMHYNNEKYYSPNKLCMDSIKLNFKTVNGRPVFMNGEGGVGVPGLKNNMVFHNAKNPDDIYIVNEYDGKYFIKHGSGDGNIYMDDSTLILYHVPKEAPLSFTGKYNLKPATDFVTNAYTTKPIRRTNDITKHK